MSASFDIFDIFQYFTFLKLFAAANIFYDFAYFSHKIFLKKNISFNPNFFSILGENVSVAVTLASNCSCCVPAVGFFIFEYSHIRQRMAEFFSKCYRGSRRRSPIRRRRSSSADRETMKNLIKADPIAVDEPKWPLRSANVDEDKSTVMFTV